MWNWTGSRPRRCLKFGSESVAWAETSRDWRGYRRGRCVMMPLAEGAVKPSPVDLNVTDVSALEADLKALIGPPQDVRVFGRLILPDTPRSAVLLLPDAAVRAVVLQLDHLPVRRDERDALIRWRLSQEQLFTLSGAKVVSQVFHDSGDGGGAWHTVLAVAIQESVLHQYESLCAAVGLIPRMVSTTSLQLFELWRRTSGARWERESLLWANVTDNALTTMVFHKGRLLFFRCKLLGGTGTIGQSDAMLEKIVQECGASLEACRQRHPYAVIKEAVICADGKPSVLQAQLEAGLDLAIEPFGWGTPDARGWFAKDGDRSMATLAAMAGVA